MLVIGGTDWDGILLRMFSICFQQRNGNSYYDLGHLRPREPSLKGKVLYNWSPCT